MLDLSRPRRKSRIGGFCDSSPSQKYSSPIRTAGKISGTAAEARTCSTPSTAARPAPPNTVNAPDSTLAAPTYSSGLSSATRVTSSSNGKCFAIEAPRFSCTKRDQALGAISTEGSTPCKRTVDTVAALPNASQIPDAMRSRQNPSSARAPTWPSPTTIPYQASKALIAPPDVPEKPIRRRTSSPRTIMAPPLIRPSNSMSTPAPNAQWLPPPWQATATVRLDLVFVFDEFIVGTDSHGRGKAGQACCRHMLHCSLIL